MSEQEILRAGDDYRELYAWLAARKLRRVLLVCGGSIETLPIHRFFQALPARLGLEVVRFSDFAPNPLYESVVQGVALLRRTRCEAIIAVGGGSAMDVAKCLKLYANADDGEVFLRQKAVPGALPLLAVPTTAGTGSEATRFAVIYYEGEKQSIADDSCLPDAVLFDPSALDTLPDYQRRATLLDALCHAVEAYWSVNSTAESRAFSTEALRLLLDNMDGYLAGNAARNAAMLRAAYLAGKAINIAQTTAGHAMCYKLTSLYHVAHGHAAALCVRRLWPFMLAHTDQCADPRGAGYLAEMFAGLAAAMGCATPEGAAERFAAVFASLGLSVPACEGEAQLDLLCRSVNPVRLKNHPIALSEADICGLYAQILQGKKGGA